MSSTEVSYQCTDCRNEVGQLDKTCPHCGANLEEVVHAEQPQPLTEEHVALLSRFNSGTGWFFWIAALSVINSLIVTFGGNWNFIFGLGITQLIDGLTYGAEGGTKLLGIVLDILIAVVFVALGVLAKRKLDWAIVLGMVLYALDGLIFLMVPDFLSIGFHAFALFSMYRGYVAMKELAQVSATISPTAVATQ